MLITAACNNNCFFFRSCLITNFVQWRENNTSDNEGRRRRRRRRDDSHTGDAARRRSPSTPYLRIKEGEIDALYDGGRRWAHALSTLRRRINLIDFKQAKSFF